MLLTKKYQPEEIFQHVLRGSWLEMEAGRAEKVGPFPSVLVINWPRAGMLWRLL